MRIAGGKYKSRSFSPGKSFKARPTTDIAKEALFNILSNRYDFEDCEILDLFSGTGSIGYEFISRGARIVTMVEMNPRHVAFIHSVLSTLGEKANVLTTDAFRFVPTCRQSYDIVFADPPYDHPHFAKIVELVLSSGIIKPNGTFIIEHSKQYDFGALPHFSELRKYGHVHFSLFTF